ncbi:hypothetical protein [Nonomuraea roseola]|uniref:Uncharacterized protein n=1 Tax=Nonomuraea roseola TaxID=46179 RepID=A0ABV5PPI7_9ACTN
MRSEAGCGTRWALASYHDSDGSHHADQPITREQIKLIRDLFERGDDEWMEAGCYPITSAIWPEVSAILGYGPPVAGVTYFIEAFSTDVSSHQQGSGSLPPHGLGAILGATRTDDHELSRTDLDGRASGDQRGERT